MTKKIGLLLICLFMISCQSQNKNLKQNNKLTNKSTIQADYFLGSWRFVEKKYLDGIETKSYPLQECMKQYTLVFEKQGSNLFLTKNYKTGKDCSIKSTSRKIPISMSESAFSYLDVDLKRTEQYKIMTKNKFSILYNDILNGKVREIEDVYEKE